METTRSGSTVIRRFCYHVQRGAEDEAARSVGQQAGLFIGLHWFLSGAW